MINNDLPFWIFNILVKLEGGFKVHKNKGETDITYAGIYKKYHPDWLGWVLLENGMNEDSNELKQLVYDFYNSLWKKHHFGLLDVCISGFVFIIGVNIGLRNAIKILQKQLNIQADGIIGNQTKLAVKKVDRTELLIKLAHGYSMYYLTICIKKNKIVFIRGWINRIFTTLKELIKHDCK